MGRGFVRDTLNVWLRKIEQELNRKLYPRNTNRFVEFYRDALYETDIKAMGEYFRSALGGPGAGDGWMSQDEVRRRLRMPPVDGGKEVYRAPRDQGARPEQSQPEGKQAE